MFDPTEGPEVTFDELWEAWLDISHIETELEKVTKESEKYRAACKKAAAKATGEYLKQVVHFIGNTDEDHAKLDDYDAVLATMKGALTAAKGHLDVLQWKFKVWQTMSANSRKVLN